MELYIGLAVMEMWHTKVTTSGAGILWPTPLNLAKNLCVTNEEVLITLE